MKKKTNFTALFICYAAIIIFGYEFEIRQFIPIFAAVTGIQVLLFFIKSGSPSARKAGIVLISIAKLLFPAIFLFTMIMINIFVLGFANIGMIFTAIETATMITAFVFEVKATNLIQLKHA